MLLVPAEPTARSSADLTAAIPDQKKWPEVAFDAAWARRVRELRKLRRWSQDDLIAAAGGADIVSQGRISQIERHADASGVKSSSAVIPICRALETPIPILGEEPEMRRWREAGARLLALDPETFRDRLGELERLVKWFESHSGSSIDESSD